MSVFEILMLLCFGAAWPFSIYKSWKSRSSKGKSAVFLVILLCGYLAGIFHKILYSYDEVIFLYMLNFVMVSVDLGFFIRNRRMAKED